MEFLKQNLQIIVFAQSRLAVEILTTYLKDTFHGPPGSSEMIRGYRGGYLPNRRREIEKGLREGVVRAVVSTNALELGIDIGALDVSVMAGYPGTIAATWQRAGRAGRRSTRSAAVLVASSAPIDQFVVRNPSYFFDASPEHALINPDNLHILVDHVKCAAFELPFADDEQFGAEDVQQVLSVLAEQGFVHHADGQWNWTNESYPADAVSLRSVSLRQLHRRRHHARRAGHRRDRLHQRSVDAAREGDLHPGRAVVPGGEARLRRPQGLPPLGRVRLLHRRDHLHEGHDSRYLPKRIAGSGKPIPHRSSLDAREGAQRAHGEVHVVSRVVGFKKIKFYTNENIGSGELDLPEQQMHTTSYWLTIPSATMQAMPFGGDDRRDGVVGLAFAMKNVAQLLLMCDGHDIGLSVDGGSLDRSTRFGGASPALRRRSPPSRTSSSTTTIRAGSASAVRCSRCTTCCSSARRS